jgi:uncharacterized membrane protein YqhA
MVWVAVVICAVSSLLLYGASVNIIWNTALDVVRDIPVSADDGKSLAVRLLKLLDLLLIAITFQIMAVNPIVCSSVRCLMMTENPKTLWTLRASMI